MSIDTKIISELRAKTGAGIVDCQKALEEANGNAEKAIEILRKKGQKIVTAKQDREAREGLIHAYIHANGRVGVLIEVNCETDFVARNEEFKTLTHDLAMQVASMWPQYIQPEDIPEAELDKERVIYQEELKKENKPAEIVDKIIEGKIKKYYEEVCLLKQAFIKDDKIKVEDYLTQKIATLGENVQVKRFIRYEL